MTRKDTGTPGRLPGSKPGNEPGSNPGSKSASKPTSKRGTSAPEDVESFLAELDHPLKPQVLALRSIILGADPSITEGIKWNAPSFRTSEWFATMRLNAKGGMQVILHFGAKKNEITKTSVVIPDPEGLLEWLAKDRAVVKFLGVDDVAAKSQAFTRIIREWIRHVS